MNDFKVFNIAGLKVVVEDKSDCLWGVTYQSSFVDNCFFGVGNNYKDALLSIANNLEKSAQAIKEFVNESYF